ncbi:MAG: glucose-1-phosphate cytidylyltransferase [Acidobacteria bacterium]|nr:MAG: glucose-1-phosphate cytidylyltransferase [Acidobacteriota bacterium]
MKTVILCGGRGTRLDEHGTAIPKGLFPIGDRPLIWHICKIYSQIGFNEFVLCLGYLKERYSEYFGLEIVSADRNNGFTNEEDWNIKLADTGLDTNTGGRIKSVESFLDGEQRFFATYGDGLSDVNLKALLEFHRSHGKIATLTAVNPISTFGLLDIDENSGVRLFREKPKLNEWINGGFFVFEREIFDYLNTDSTLEKSPFRALAAEGQLMAFRHGGFWKCMDTYKDSIEMNELWAQGAPWRSW